MIGTGHFVALAGLAFLIGVAGSLRRRGSVLLVVMSAQIVTLAAIMLGAATAPEAASATVTAYALSVMIGAIAQVSVAAAIIICVYRNRGALALRRINAPRG
ncbi:MAG: NADH-quinone oxidoreductase subunit K [Pseudomonadota bacterium]